MDRFDCSNFNNKLIFKISILILIPTGKTFQMARLVNVVDY